jgi:hypothetical protein
MAGDDTFCGQCGAPVEADLPETEPEWSTTAPTQADAVRACPSGHLNPPENVFCATCGHEIAPPASSPAAAVQSHPLRGVAVAAVVLVVAVGSILALTRTEPDSTAPTEDAALRDDTTTTSPTDACIDEITAWLEYVTQPGASVMDAAAEYGIQSPGYEMVTDAWESWNSNLYQVGRDEAAYRAVLVIETQCAGQLGQGYEPGHMPQN